MKSKLLFLSLLATFGTASAASAQNLLVNGGFEAPTIGDSCCNTVTVPNSFPGWTVTAGDINIVNGTFSSSPGGTNLAHGGDQYLDLIGQGTAGAIQQSFATVVGQAYNFSFWYSHNLFGGLPLAAATYSVGGLSGTVTHSTGSNSNLDWQRLTGGFVATGSTTTLNFTNTINGTNAGVLLDDVAVTAVPEPASWALMIMGFGLVGGLARRRNIRSATA